jgi:hypothetical protein
LQEQGYEKLSAKLQKQSGVDNQTLNKFTKLTIENIFNDYIMTHPKLQKLFKEEEVEKPKKSKKQETPVSSRKQSVEV